MKRREFIKKAGLTAAASVAAPYILRSGALNGSPNSGLASHVVMVMFAGGVRQQESVLQRYLTDSQNLTGSQFEGNILSNMLTGGCLLYTSPSPRDA